MVNALVSQNKVALDGVRLLLGWVTGNSLWTGKPSRYVLCNSPRSTQPFIPLG